MNKNILLGIGICGVLACLSAPARAQFTSYDNPTSTWLTSTAGVNIVGNPSDSVTTLGGGAFSIDFSKAGTIGQIGTSSQTMWSSSPYSALNQGDSTLYFSSATDFTFSKAISSFGFELQTRDLIRIRDISVEFYNGSTVVGTITRTIDNTGVFSAGLNPNNSGARLFAGSFDAGITSVKVQTTSRNGVLAGGFRYAALGGNNNVTNNSAVPEPGEWAAMAMMVTGLGGLVVRARRRRRA